MGYILPVTHYNYHEYQNRMKEPKESPHYVSSPYKAVYHQLNNDYDLEQSKYKAEQWQDTTNDDNEVNEQSDEHYHMFHLTDGERIDLTGKGGNIDAQI